MYCLYCFKIKQRNSKNTSKKGKNINVIRHPGPHTESPSIAQGHPKVSPFCFAPSCGKMADKDELVSGCDISGNPPSLATFGSHRDTSLIAELLSNSTFITSLSEAVAKQISVSSNFASSSTGSLAGSTNETDPSKPSESSKSVVNSGEASGSTKGSATKDKRAPEGDEPNASNNKKPRVQKPPLITIDGQDSNDLPASVELEDELTTSGRWEASDELSALLPLLFTKELSTFE